MAIKPTISLKGLRSSAADSGRTTKSIQTSLSSNVRQKKNLYSDIKIIKKRREERDKRNLLQTKLLAPTTVTRRNGAKFLASSTQQGLSIGDRLMGFLKYATAGWILGNLPSWTFYGNQFSNRVKTASSILSNYGDETLKVLTGITDLFSSVFKNITNFDFFDSSSLVKNSFTDLTKNVDDLGKGIVDAFNVLVAPFEKYRPPEPTPPGPGPGGGAGAGNWKNILDLVSKAEGGYDSVNYGRGPGKIPGLSKMTIREAYNASERYRAKYGGTGAMGAYQLVDNPLGRATKSGLNVNKDLFSPENQDKIAVYLIEKERGVTPDLIKNDPNKAALKLAQLFAGIPVLAPAYSSYAGRTVRRGESFYQGYGGNRANVSAEKVEQAFKNFSNQPAPITQSQRNLPPNAPQFDPNKRYRRGDVLTGSIGRGVSYVEIRDVLGAPRSHGPHQGIDIFCPQGTYIALRLDCEVVFAGWENASNHSQGYGQVIDVWVPDFGVQLRFGHCAGFLVTSGKVKAGKSFARVGKSGNASDPHIHFEYTRNRGSASGISGDPSPYIPYILLTTQANNPTSQAALQSRPSTPLVPAAPATTAEEQQAQIDNSYTQGLREGLTQERQGRRIVVIDDRSSPIVQQVVSGNDGYDSTITISESALLNNFIKNKLLLDLNYV